MRTITVSTLLVWVVLNITAQNFIDPQTTIDIKPVNNNIGNAWALDFSDEFNGSAVNTTKWNIDNSTTSRAARPGIGILSWFWKPANVAVANGNLILKVTKETSSKMHCGSINSKDKYMTTYGYFEARIKIADATKGTHTAFWLQGPNMGNVDGTGNDGAEIDIFESAWTGDYTKSVIHIDGYGTSHQANTKQYTTPGIHSGYQTFGMWWTKDFIKIYYNGALKVTYSDVKWIPQVDEFLWLSDGASFGFPDGDPCFTSQPLGFLTEAYVDYIRVWKPQLTAIDTPTKSAGIVMKTSNNKVHIEAPSFISEVNVFDSLGRKLAQHVPKTTTFMFDVQGTGVYIVETKLENGDYSSNKVLIKQDFR
jgi:beta-glucanase (GH16 family)